jgi:SAM-dependent methyltransferase
VLDVGCGTGVFLRVAADRRAQAFGLDASEALLEIARARVPEADVRVGGMEDLRFEDAAFDLVTGFNTFFFATDMVAALREAGRVAKPGAAVVVQVWGRPERCDLEAMKRAVAPFLPPAGHDAPRGSSLWQPGALEELALAAGLTPGRTLDTSWAYEFAGDDELVRCLLSAGGIAERVGPAREADVRCALLAALEPYRGPDGRYRLANEWHFLIASRSGGERS